MPEGRRAYGACWGWTWRGSDDVRDGHILDDVGGVEGRCGRVIVWMELGKIWDIWEARSVEERASRTRSKL